VKRIFTDRERLVVYLERAEVIRMTAAAREAGETLVEWARGALRNELICDSRKKGNDGKSEDHRAEDGLRVSRAVLAARRGVAAGGGREEPAARVEGKACKHGVGKGWHCWQCGGKAVIE
jgi:hypothetical protein